MTFDGHPVTFQIERNEKMMVNATEMAKAFGKKVNHFMELDSTKEFVKEALKSRDVGYLKVFSQSDKEHPSFGPTISQRDMVAADGKVRRTS